MEVAVSFWEVFIYRSGSFHHNLFYLFLLLLFFILLFFLFTLFFFLFFLFSLNSLFLSPPLCRLLFGWRRSRFFLIFFDPLFDFLRADWIFLLSFCFGFLLVFFPFRRGKLLRKWLICEPGLSSCFHEIWN